MPHLHIEFSKTLERKANLPALFSALHQGLVASSIFPTAGIRIRAFAADYAIVADGLPENDFLAMTLSVGAGRETSVLQKEGDVLFKVAQDHLSELLSGTHFTLSLEIRVVDADLSWKVTPIHTRLSGQAKG